MPEPSSAQGNRFYTREFFADCAIRLGRSGVLGLRLHTAENLWTPAQIERVRSIEVSLRAHFEHVLVVPGTPTLLLASAHWDPNQSCWLRVSRAAESPPAW